MQKAGIRKTVIPWISKYFLRQWYLEKANFRIVDVRGSDFRVGKLPNTINIPAENFEMSVESLMKSLKYNKVDKVIFTCNKSENRAPRCAQFFADYAKWNDEEFTIGVLQEGWVGWQKYAETHCPHLIEKIE